MSTSIFITLNRAQVPLKLRQPNAQKIVEPEGIQRTEGEMQLQYLP